LPEGACTTYTSNLPVTPEPPQLGEALPHPFEPTGKASTQYVRALVYRPGPRTTSS
jgi:hypothetical protein